MAIFRNFHHKYLTKIIVIDSFWLLFHIKLTSAAKQIPGLVYDNYFLGLKTNLLWHIQVPQYEWPIQQTDKEAGRSSQGVCPILNKKICILPDGQLWEWLTGGVALPQPKCNWSVGFAIARWPVGKASDNARIMLSSLFRFSLV